MHGHTIVSYSMYTQNQSLIQYQFIDLKMVSDISTHPLNQTNNLAGSMKESHFGHIKAKYDHHQIYLLLSLLSL